MSNTKKKPIMVIGSIGVGKSTLLKALQPNGKDVRKTESIIYMDEAIDTPGEMISIPRLYNSLILNSVRASLILVVMSAIKPDRLPPNIGRAMRAPILGVITKIDLADEQQIEKARAALKQAGAAQSVSVSAVNGQGLETLVEAIEHIQAGLPGAD